MLDKMQELQERLDDAQRRRVQLSPGKSYEPIKYRRPTIRLTIDRDPSNEDCEICITIEESMGHPVQWIELTADDACTLARHLTQLANYLEAGHVDGEEVEDEPSKEEGE